MIPSATARRTRTPRSASLFQASLVSGAFALGPAPLAPLLPGEADPLPSPHLHGDAFELGIGGEVEELLDGGQDPRIAIGSASILARGSLSDRNWQIEVLSGRGHSWTEGHGSELSARWRAPQGPAIAMRFRRGDLVQLTLEQREGSMRGTGSVAIPLSDRIEILAAGFHSRDRGTLKTALEPYPEIAIGWSQSRTGADGGLGVRIGPFGKLKARIGRSESEPLDLEALHVLRTDGGSTTWSVRWDPDSTGPWLALQSHHGRVASRASIDTAGSSRTFHDLLLRSSVQRSEGGWAWPRWRSGVGWSRTVVEIPAPSFFSPFLSWNALNPSEWAPVEQILSDQREFLHGTLEIRRLHTDLLWNLARGRGRAEMGASTSWWAVDPRFIRRTSRMSFLGAGYRTESDTIDSWRLRAWTVVPSLDLAWDGGAWGEISGRATATLPLAFRRLGPSRAEASDEGAGESWRGLWNAGFGWRRSF